MSTLFSVLLPLYILLVVVDAGQVADAKLVEYTPCSPVVGILAPLALYGGNLFVPPNDAAIPEYVVKFLRSAAVQVVVLHEEDPDLESVLSRLSGVYFPGASVDVDFDQPYEQAALRIYNYAKKRHSENDPFPLIGVGRGYHLLAALAAGTPDVISKDPRNAKNALLTLQIVDDGGDMLGSLPLNVKEILQTKPVTHNDQMYGVLPEMWERFPGLNEQFLMTSTSKDPVSGKIFSATIESRPGKAPMYGIEWHPETIPYLWDPDKVPASAKTPESLRVSSEVGLFINRLFSDKLNRFETMHNYFVHRMSVLFNILHRLCTLLVTVGAARLDDDTFDDYTPWSPVVGILVHPFVHNGTRLAGGFIPEHIPRFLESAGVQVAVLHEKEPHLESLLPLLSGVYFPDGVLDIDLNQPYEQAALKIYNYAKKRHSENDSFPLIGICQGHQLLAALAAGTPDAISKNAYKSTNVSLPLQFVEDGGKMLGSLPADLKKILQTKPITYNNHDHGIPPEMWERFPGLNEQFMMTSTSEDPVSGRIFSATMESRPGKAPMYGIQFHSETVPYAWSPLVKSALVKTHESLRITTEISLFINSLFHDKPSRFGDIGQLQGLLVETYDLRCAVDTGAAEGRCFHHIPDPTLLGINLPFANLLDITMRESDAFIPEYMVKFLESTGSQVVPIHEKDPDLESVLSRLSGVYLPDGVLDIDFDQPYEQAALRIYNYAKKRHSENDPFPLIGVGRGYHLLAALAAGTPDVISKDPRNTPNVALPLRIVDDGGDMLGSLPLNVKEILQTKAVRHNDQMYGVLPEMWERFPGLNEQFLMTSTTKDPVSGKIFSATMESRSGKAPMYGIEWHPGTVPYVWIPGYESILMKTRQLFQVTSAFGLFFNMLFISKPNRFEHVESLGAALVQNYKKTCEPLALAQGACTYLVPYPGQSGIQAHRKRTTFRERATKTIRDLFSRH
ncbi:hypothetical protein FOL47_000887 [Perkinsus chesapeaki]|uniref:folate gamma-glutamyl hydrolase n=1 Tax=Perkinsus chesapeaki TaxID=330153 RepID=A0A7J6MKZ3_PERCH|nr:hypothetical protein FOL47_000887 [Perkinsus chesapeaki]